jgi:hypothetical protein
LHFARAGLSRFPLTIAAAIIATSATIVSIHAHSDQVAEVCLRISLTMIFGMPLLIAASYASELHPSFRWTYPLAAVIAMTAVSFLVPEKNQFESVYSPWFRFWMLLLMAIALTSVTPGLAGEGSHNWWRVNIGWLNAFVLSFIMAVIVQMGLQLALLSVEKLFGLETRYGTLMGRLHGDLFAIGCLLIAPVTALSLFPSANEELNADQPGFKIWGNLGKWGLIPIGFLFMGILAAYAVKIVIQWKLPNGMVATPVLSLGGYGTLAMLLIRPWREKESWARWFSNIYPVAFLLSSIMLFVSVAVRIDEYGLTFARYSALVAGIWIAVSALILLTRRNQAPILITSLLALMTFLAALGPSSAGNLSFMSQSERLKHLLRAANHQNQQIASVVRMIVEDFGLADLEKVTGPLGLDSKLNRWQLAEKALQKMHLSSQESSIQKNYQCPSDAPIPIAGCTLYWTPTQGWGLNTPISLGKNDAGKEFILQKSNSGENKLILSVSHREVASKSIDDLDFETARKNGSPLTVSIAGEGRIFLIVITQANWNQNPGESIKHFNSFQFQIFERPLAGTEIVNERKSSLPTLR